MLTVPKALLFKTTDAIEAADVCNAVILPLGLSNRKSSTWKGMVIDDPFLLPRCVVAINVHGCDSLNFNLVKPVKYGISGAGIEEALHEASDRIEESDKQAAILDFNDGPVTVRHFRFDVFGQLFLILWFFFFTFCLFQFAPYEQYFGEINCKSEKVSTTNLKSDNVQHKKFLDQLTCAYAFCEKLANTPTTELEFIDMRLVALADDNAAVKAEALKLVTDCVEKCNAAAVNAYGKDNVFVFSTCTVTSRTKRAVEANVKGDPIVSFISLTKKIVKIIVSNLKNSIFQPTDLNLAKTYSEDYPVIFNIILWFGVVLAFSLLAISYAIASMDPGRDSIIYRMTSNRIKKDN